MRIAEATNEQLKGPTYAVMVYAREAVRPWIASGVGEARALRAKAKGDCVLYLIVTRTSYVEQLSSDGIDDKRGTILEVLTCPIGNFPDYLCSCVQGAI